MVLATFSCLKKDEGHFDLPGLSKSSERNMLAMTSEMRKRFVVLSIAAKALPTCR